MSRAVIPCDCASPAHCLEATGGEQGLTADELELVRLRNEVAELRRERDQFERAIAALVAAADACDREAERHPSSRSSAPMVRHINAMARLRAVLGERRGP